jgi:hypothetical protein
LASPPEGSKPRDTTAQEVDRLLRQLKHPTVQPQRPTRLRVRRLPVVASPRVELPSPLSVWGRVALSLLLVLAMTQWPYAHACGFPLAAYLIAVAVVLAAGVWAAHAAWRAYIGLAHIAALVVFFLGTFLVANQVMPRLGYAPVEVTWRCPA